MTSALAPPRADRFERDLFDLARFVEADQPGWTRRVFGSAFAASRSWVADAMAGAGLEVRVDPIGNVIGVLPGRRRDAPPLVTGSHTDTVAGGGRFDGILGVLGAIEAARLLRDEGATLERDVVVVDFLGEEPNDFGLSCVGSRALAGTLTDEHLALVDPAGRRLADALGEMDVEPNDIATARWAGANPLAFVELHIEQGPVLEAAGAPIGVVDAIAGILRFRAEFIGRADHAGTMPMGSRRDAACAAAEGVLALESVAHGDDGVATAGRLELEPGSFNVVPALAHLWGELRSTDPAWLLERRRTFDDAVVAAGRRRSVDTDVEWLSDVAPTPCAVDLQIALERAANGLGLRSVRLPSRAGHDAVQMATITPTGMVFVPSRAGRSHVPEEWTDPDQCVAGIHVLAETLVALDATAGS